MSSDTFGKIKDDYCRQYPDVTETNLTMRVLNLLIEIHEASALVQPLIWHKTTDKFQRACGNDEPDSASTEIDENVTCPECLKAMRTVQPEEGRLYASRVLPSLVQWRARNGSVEYSADGFVSFNVAKYPDFARHIEEGTLVPVDSPKESPEPGTPAPAEEKVRVMSEKPRKALAEQTDDAMKLEDGLVESERRFNEDREAGQNTISSLKSETEHLAAVLKERDDTITRMTTDQEREIKLAVAMELDDVARLKSEGEQARWAVYAPDNFFIGFYATREEADKISNECNFETTVEPLYRHPAYGAACGGEKWTPCSEKMPEPGTVCLVTRADGFVLKYTFTDGGKWINLIGDVSRRKVLAWRPIPAAYQPAKQEKP